MSKDARNRMQVTNEAMEKVRECVAVLAAGGFGERPPKETTFAEIEEFGHEMGRLVARALDEYLMTQHGTHFPNKAPCPVCQTLCDLKESSGPRNLQTIDGNIPIPEPCYHCPVCHRDFFPSTHRIED